MGFFVNQEQLVMQTMDNDRLTRDQKGDVVHEILLQCYLHGSLEEIGFGDEDEGISPAKSVWDRQNTPHENKLMKEIRDSFNKVKKLLSGSSVEVWY